MEPTTDPTPPASRTRPSGRPPGWIAARALRAFGALLFLGGILQVLLSVGAVGREPYGPQFEPSLESLVDVLSEVVPTLLAGTVLFAFAAVVELLQRIERALKSPDVP